MKKIILLVILALNLILAQEIYPSFSIVEGCYENCKLKGYAAEECEKICSIETTSSTTSAIEPTASEECFKKCLSIGASESDCKVKCYGTSGEITEITYSPSPLDECIKKCVSAGGEYDNCKLKCSSIYTTSETPPVLQPEIITSFEKCFKECSSIGLSDEVCKEKCEKAVVSDEKLVSILNETISKIIEATKASQETIENCISKCISIGKSEEECKAACFTLGINQTVIKNITSEILQKEEVRRILPLVSPENCTSTCYKLGMNEEECNSKCGLVKLITSEIKPVEINVSDVAKTISKSCREICIEKGGEKEECDRICRNTTNVEAVKNECNLICKEKGFTNEECKRKCEVVGKNLMNSSGCIGDCIATGKSFEECSKICIKIDVKKIGEIEELKFNVSARIPVTQIAIAVNDKNEMLNITSDELKIIRINETQMIRIPVALKPEEKLKEFSDEASGFEIRNRTATINIKDEFGNKVGRIVAKIDEVKGMENVATAVVKEAALEIEEKSVELKTPIEEITKPKISISANLKRIPEETAIIKIKDVNISDPTFDLALKKLEEKTKEMNLSIKSKGVIIEVKKTNIKDIEDVGETKIKTKISKKWVLKNGGTEKVKMLRYGDDGISEILNTSMIGEDSENYIFEAISPRGLSLYALVTVEYMAPLEEKKLPIDLVLIGTFVIIVVVAGSILIFRKKR